MEIDEDLDLSGLPARGREKILALAEDVENLRAASNRKGDVLEELKPEIRRIEQRVQELEADGLRPQPRQVTGATHSSPGGVVDPLEIEVRKAEQLRARVARITHERDAINVQLGPKAGLLARVRDELLRRGFGWANMRHLVPRAEAPL